MLAQVDGEDALSGSAPTIATATKQGPVVVARDRTRAPSAAKVSVTGRVPAECHFPLSGFSSISKRRRLEDTSSPAQEDGERWRRGSIVVRHGG